MGGQAGHVEMAERPALESDDFPRQRAAGDHQRARARAAGKPRFAFDFLYARFVWAQQSDPLFVVMARDAQSSIRQAPRSPDRLASLAMTPYVDASPCASVDPCRRAISAFAVSTVTAASRQ